MNNLVPAGTATRGRRPASTDPQTIRERIRGLVKELQHGRRRAGEDELATRLVERLSEDDEALQIAARFVVRIVLHENEARTRRQASMPTSQSTHRAEVKTKAQAVAERVKETVLLDLIMPNGVAMRYCSGTQMAGFGKAYEKIAERVGAAMVGEVMVEHEVRELLRV